MKIIVAYQATPQGLDALNWGIELALATGAHLNIALVLRRPGSFTVEYPPTGQVDEALMSQAFQWLKEALKLVPEEVDCSACVCAGHTIAEGLIDHAERVGGDLLVVGGASSSPLKRHKLGTVADDLLFGSPLPVALIPRGYQRKAITRINCAVGTRPGSGSLVRTGFRLANETRLPLRLVAVLSDGASAQAARENADSIVQRVVQSGVQAPEDYSTVVGESTEITAAVETVGWTDGDVLLVGSSRVEQKRRVFAGSIVMYILRELSVVPVVVVPRNDN